jgi:hypothetical protein
MYMLAIGYMVPQGPVGPDKKHVPVLTLTSVVKCSIRLELVAVTMPGTAFTSK